MTKKPRILIYDLETSPNKGYFFDLYNGTRPEFVIKEKSILTIAYKWHGEGTPAEVISVADFKSTFKKDPYDDSKVVAKFIKIMRDADYIVAHYGAKFDQRFLNARVLANGLPPMHQAKMIDTWKLSKKHFLLNSNKLDHLGNVLGVGRKMHTDWTLWVKCVSGDVEAMKYMADYNKQDVDLLDQVFEKLKPYVITNINIAKHEEQCPRCASDNVQNRGTAVTASGRKARYQCQDCGGWFQGKTMLTKTHNKQL